VSVTYPLFAFEKDDKSMRLIENESRILSHLEAIDIENDEYVFWDASGEGVSVAVSVGAFKSKLESVTSRPSGFPIQDVLKAYTTSLGLSEAVAEGTPRMPGFAFKQNSENDLRNGVTYRGCFLVEV